MAVIDRNTNEWINSDGLKVLFANDGARPNRGGEYCNYDSGRHCLEFVVRLADLTTDDLILADNVSIPSGAIIEEVEIFATEAAVGGTSIDVGLVRFDYTTQTASDGVLNNAPIADYNADGDKTVYRVGVTGAGTQFGARQANANYITANAAGTFTDGVIRLRIYYVVVAAADVD